MTIEEYFINTEPEELIAEFKAFCRDRRYEPREDVMQAIVATHYNPALIAIIACHAQ